MLMSRERLSVIGLGYVGLPVACLAVEKGFEVTGIDINLQRLEQIRNGISPFKDKVIERVVGEKRLEVTSSYDNIGCSDVITLSVPTPVDGYGIPSYQTLEGVCRSISQHLTAGQMIIIESTVGPSVFNNQVIPILETSGLKRGEDFYLAHCPERINPGDEKWGLENIPRVIGARSRLEAEKAKEFYHKLINDVEIYIIGSLEEVATVKDFENAFRDVNIALVNALAKYCDRWGMDIQKIIKGASTKPFAFLPHHPSVGVGGYCVPYASRYISNDAQETDSDIEIFAKAREINDNMPSYAVGRLKEALTSIGIDLSQAKVALLGKSYKGNIGEFRCSPADEVEVLLRESDVELVIYDPYLEESTVSSLEEAVGHVDAIFIATDHDEFKKLNNSFLDGSRVKVILDGKNFLNKEDIIKQGIIYKGIGR